MSLFGRQITVRPPPADEGRVERVEVDRPLRTVLAFTRRSIDDVVNSPVAKAEVLGYYKLSRWCRRQSEAVDLDRWWSGRDTRPTRRRGQR